jgi:hypothetical protein
VNGRTAGSSAASEEAAHRKVGDEVAP